MANKIDICNEALDKLGVETITSFSDDSKQARHCSRRYDRLRKKLLRSHWWNFAIKREILVSETSTETGKVAEAGSTTNVINLTAHGLDIDNEISFTSTSGNFNGTRAFVSLVIDADSFQLDRTLPSAVSAGDTFDVFKNKPKFDFSNQFSLPSDNLRILVLESKLRTFKYQVESDKIVANTDEIGFQYIQDIEDVDLMDSTFQEALTYLLAHEMAYPLIQTASIAQQMYEKYLLELRDIRSIDSMVGSPQTLFAEEWNESRLTGSTLRRGDGSL